MVDGTGEHGDGADPVRGFNTGVGGLAVKCGRKRIGSCLLANDFADWSSSIQNQADPSLDVVGVEGVGTKLADFFANSEH